MVALRFVYSLVPLTLTVGSLVLAMVTFFGCFRTATSGIENIYYMRLNLENIEVKGFDVSTLVRILGIYPIYQVGSGGYCYGIIGDDDKVKIIDCKTPTTPYWFDLRGIFQNTLAGDVLDNVEIPSEVLDYESTIKKSSWAHWILLIIVSGISFIMLVLGVFSAWSKGLSCFILFLAILNMLAAIGAAGIATALFTIYHNKFNETVDQFGATATMGSTGMGMVWGTVLATVLSAFFWIFTVCCGSTRKNKDKDSDYSKHREGEYQGQYHGQGQYQGQYVQGH